MTTGSRSFLDILRPLVALAAVAVALALVVGAWDDTGAATGEVSMRIFLAGWAVAAVILSVGLAFAVPARRRERPAPRLASLTAAQHLAAGLVIGLAVGTTDWTTLHLAGWWQLWWTIPLLLTYASLVVTLRRSSGTWR